MTAPREKSQAGPERSGTTSRSTAEKLKQDAGAQTQDWADVIGPNATEYYLERFRQIESGNKRSWHWPAFFLTLGWLFYRKLWLHGLAYLVLLPAGLAVTLSLAARLMAEHGIIVAYALVFGLIFLVLPLYANRVYFRKVQRAIARIDRETSGGPDRRDRLGKAGGTHLLLAILAMLIPGAIIGVLIAASVPAYRDYAARAEVEAGLDLAAGAQAAIAHHYREHGAWPVDNAAAGIAGPRELGGRQVDSVAIDSGVIIVTYGRSGQRSLQGKRLILNPDADRLPAVEWICFSPDIPARLLPAACRGQGLP